MGYPAAVEIKSVTFSFQAIRAICIYSTHIGGLKGTQSTKSYFQFLSKLQASVNAFKTPTRKEKQIDGSYGQKDDSTNSFCSAISYAANFCLTLNVPHFFNLSVWLSLFLCHSLPLPIFLSLIWSFRLFLSG